MDKEYIPREAALKVIQTSTAPALEIKYIPAADVVEVVRCKDCKHRFNYDICAYRGDDWFCGYGERRSDNG